MEESKKYDNDDEFDNLYFNERYSMDDYLTSHKQLSTTEIVFKIPKVPHNISRKELINSLTSQHGRLKHLEIMAKSVSIPNNATFCFENLEDSYKLMSCQHKQEVICQGYKLECEHYPKRFVFVKGTEVIYNLIPPASVASDKDEREPYYELERPSSPVFKKRASPTSFSYKDSKRFENRQMMKAIKDRQFQIYLEFRDCYSSMMKGPCVELLKELITLIVSSNGEEITDYPPFFIMNVMKIID